MASSIRETHRRPLDFYETPKHYTDALIDRIGTRLSDVYDPCVGRRAILTRLRERGFTGRTHSNDLNPRRAALTHFDASVDGDAWGRLGIDWCISNPPFSKEIEILTLALRFHKHVAFLARLSFLEPTVERDAFWRRHLSRLEDVIVLTRWSFRRNKKGHKGNDSQTCMWLVFGEAVGDGVFLTIDGRRA